MLRVAALWRHPIKSHGREALEQVTLTAGKTMPWDRVWAVIHEATKFNRNDPQWVMCCNFMIGTSTPALAGIWAELDTSQAMVSLHHNALGTIRFAPDNPSDVDRFLAWVAPLYPEEGRRAAGMAKVPERGMTDTDYPSVSIMTLASHDAVTTQLGHPLETERWRGNIWLDGGAAWQEELWIGKDVQIGDAVLHIKEPIIRCKHTMANPRTGLRDADTLAALRDGRGHQNFGVYATVVKGGKITRNDTAKVI